MSNHRGRRQDRNGSIAMSSTTSSSSSLPSVVLTRPSVADQGQMSYTPPLDIHLNSPFGSPQIQPVRSASPGFLPTQLDERLERVSPIPETPSRGRKYPSSDSYDITTPPRGTSSPRVEYDQPPCSPQPEQLPYLQRANGFTPRIGSPAPGSPALGPAGSPGAFARDKNLSRHTYANDVTGSPVLGGQEYPRQNGRYAGHHGNSPARSLNLDEDSDSEDADVIKGKKAQRIFLSMFGRYLPYALLDKFSTPYLEKKPKTKNPLTLVNDTRRKSTGTASATIRAKKQKERERRVASGKGSRFGSKRWVVLFGLATLVWWMYFSGSGSDASESDENDSLGHSEGSQKATVSTTSTIIRPPREKLAAYARHLSPESIYVNLPEHIINPAVPLHPIVDGRLQVNLSSPAKYHPIYQLIKTARDDWDAKVKRQSKTLKDAVKEYQKRNRGRMPPKGFEKWWEFVVEHDVPLPDEYDQINKDMHLFRAYRAKDLSDAVDRAAELPDTFTLAVHDGAVRTRSTYDHEAIPGADERLEAQVELLMNYGIEEWTGNFKAVYGVHDTPQGFIGWDHRSDLVEMVEDEEYIEHEEEIDTTVRGWPAACSYTSPAKSFDRYSALTHQTGKALEGKTFIANHASLFDLCQHPELLGLHGMLSGRNPHVQPELLPVFSLSKTTLNTDILGVPTEQWVSEMPAIPWKQRSRNRLMWRGSNTGAYHSTETTWRDSHRARLVKMTTTGEDGDHDEVWMLPAPLVGGEQSLKDTAVKGIRSGVNSQMLDIAFAGKPLQCNEEDGTCDDLMDEYTFKAVHMTFEEALQFKFIVDIDGNTWSSRFERLLTGGSLIFKSTVMPEWWTTRVQPWVHYVPIQLDYSDLHDVLTFFRGDVFGQGGEDALAEQIATAGKDWAATHWRKVDMAAYVGRMYLEWARLLAPNRASMDFVYHPDMEVEVQRPEEASEEDVSE